MKEKFSFCEKGSHAAILYGGQEIIRLEKNSHFFGCAYGAWDQVMAPGGRPEVASVPMFSDCGAEGHVTDVAYTAEKEGNGLRLTIIPTAAKKGKRSLLRMAQQVVLSVHLENDRFVWNQRYSVEARDDVRIAPDAGNEIFGFYRMPRPDGLPGIYVQFADPQPVNASGPAVPMTHDWQMHYEPYVGPETFRKTWKRDYVRVIFQNPDGTFHTSELNKTKWHNLTLDNRRARLCHPQGLLYVVKDTGEALEIRCDAPSHYHHVCEWGMDFHFWCDVEPFLQNGVLKAGTVISGTTVTRLVSAEVVDSVLRRAAPIELTERERFIADLPAYEEPENTFAVSALERLDAQPWQPMSEGCAWDRHDGRTPGRGCLIIVNDRACDGSWRQDMLGPSQWGNPFVPGGRYGFSAWVRMDAIRQEPNWPVPMIGVEAFQYDGPASSSPPRKVEMGWKQLGLAPQHLRAGRMDWTHVELVTPPFPSYVLRASLILRLVGRGAVRFADVRWELDSE